MTAMMALRAHARGGPEELVYESAPVPTPGPGEALVAVHAAGITFAELTWDLSWTRRDGRDRTPVIPAHEVSGVISALGPGATGLGVGDEVFGLIDFDRNGAAVGYVTVPAAHLAARPAAASQAETASLPLAALTAWQALVDHANLQAGDQVLVQGGAGGVGVYAVQLAAILGGQVTATGRERDGAFIRSLGAQAFAAAGTTISGGFDVVIDTVGRRGPGGLVRSPAARRAAGDPRRPAVAGKGGRPRGARDVLRRYARCRRTHEAGRAGGPGQAPSRRQPDLPGQRRQAGVRKRPRTPPTGQNRADRPIVRQLPGSGR